MMQRPRFSLSKLALLISSGLLATHINAQTLADFHTDELGNDCQACHQADMKVGNAETHENGACIDCHGTNEALFAASGKSLSPHHSHLIDLSCTSCHSAHAEPVMVCQACHDSFKTAFKMPFATKPVEDNYIYPEVSQAEKDQALKAGPIEKRQLIVIGAGASGHSAAVSAKQHGVEDVLIIEKQPYIGGNGMLAAGGMASAETLTQAFKGYQDSKTLWYNDTMKGGHNKNNPELVQTLIDNGSAGVDWLQSLGADMSSAAAAGGHNAERLHRPSGGAKAGPEVIKTLKTAAKQLGVETRTNTKVLELVQDNSGKVIGVLVQGKHSGVSVIAADAVVIASGGFARNNDMVAKYRPDLKNVASTNNPGDVGEGLIFGEKAGAALVDVDQIQAFPTAAAGKMVISGTARGAGAIMLNRKGERFVDEMGPRDKVSEAVWQQDGGDSWLVFDETVFQRLGQLRGMLTLGIIYQGNNPSEVAKATGMDAATFEKHINRYNGFQKAGKDQDFGRKNMADNFEYPIYAVKVKPAIHHTMGGLVINKHAQVLNKAGKPIAGLFAAGEVTGGVHGGNRLAGNAIADTIVFGRIAGESASELLK